MLISFIFISLDVTVLNVLDAECMGRLVLGYSLTNILFLYLIEKIWSLSIRSDLDTLKRIAYKMFIL